MLDDGRNAAVKGGHHTQVRSRQPPKRRAPQPLSTRQEQIEDLIVGCLEVRAVRHRLRPRAQNVLGAVRAVEVRHRGANVGRVLRLGQRLVTPEVEDCHIPVAIWPTAGQEECWELMELEVHIKENHGQLGRLKLAEDEGGLQRDCSEAKLLRALECVRSVHVGW